MGKYPDQKLGKEQQSTSKESTRKEVTKIKMEHNEIENRKKKDLIHKSKSISLKNYANRETTSELIKGEAKL